MSTTPWKTVIVEDEPAASNLLKILLRDYCPQVKVLAEASDVETALACINKLKPNLVFLDIELLDGNAFDILNQLKAFKGQVVFASAHDEFAARAFRFNPIDYLLKPISPDALLEVMKRLEMRVQPSEILHEASAESLQATAFEKIVINTAGIQYVVQITDIIHLKGDGNYSTVYLSNGEKILVTKPLKHFEDILPEKLFFRVHQSHIVNLHNVKSISKGDTHQITLNDGETVPLARRKKDAFIARFLYK